jgi:predicted dehydrogenase
MGFFNRLRGQEDKRPPVKAAVFGDGPEAGRLAAAYQVNKGIELVGAEEVSYGDGVIRQPVVKTPGLDALDDVIRTPGLKAVEIDAPPGDRKAAAEACVKAGLFTSVNPPTSTDELDELRALAKNYKTGLRFRLLPLYYPPFRELKRLIDEDAVGRPMMLKMTTRRGKGTDLPDGLAPGRWIAEHELGFLALAQWLIGPIEKVHARLESKGNGAPPSSVISWKYQGRHQYGYFQLDFCPGLHVRTFTEPVHRFIELTGIGGLIMATRGEGQLMRMPALMVRGKSTTTAFELIPDDWREIYKRLAAETVKAMNRKARVIGSAGVVKEALMLVEAARRSAEEGDEVPFS